MSLEFSGLLRPDLRQLLGFEVNSEGRGFQGAHVLGRSAVASQLDDLFNFMNNGTLDPLGADHVSNGVLLPGSNKSNTGVASAIMGTAAHSGANVAAFDKLFFDAGAREGQSNKFINKLLDSIELAPSHPDYKTPQQMRIEFKNFLDFVKIQFMYQDVLDRLPDTLKGPTGLHSLGFNSADPRWQNAAEVNTYLRGLDANLFDYNTVSNHPLYQKIGSMRVGDAGFLVIDENGSGTIEDASEMFGGRGRTGVDFAALIANDNEQTTAIRELAA